MKECVFERCGRVHEHIIDFIIAERVGQARDVLLDELPILVPQIFGNDRLSLA